MQSRGVRDGTIAALWCARQDLQEQAGPARACGLKGHTPPHPGNHAPQHAYFGAPALSRRRLRACGRWMRQGRLRQLVDAAQEAVHVHAVWEARAAPAGRRARDTADSGRPERRLRRRLVSGIRSMRRGAADNRRRLGGVGGGCRAAEAGFAPAIARIRDAGQAYPARKVVGPARSCLRHGRRASLSGVLERRHVRGPASITEGWTAADQIRRARVLTGRGKFGVDVVCDRLGEPARRLSGMQPKRMVMMMVIETLLGSGPTCW